MSLSEKEKMAAKLPHFPYDPELIRLRQQAKQILFQLNYQLSPIDPQRKTLLKRLLGKSGDDLHINSPFSVITALILKSVIIFSPIINVLFWTVARFQLGIM